MSKLVKRMQKHYVGLFEKYSYIGKCNWCLDISITKEEEAKAKHKKVMIVGDKKNKEKNPDADALCWEHWKEIQIWY